MKNLSSLAVALSLVVGAAGFAGAANAATTTTIKQQPSKACIATKTKPCPQKHAGLTSMHKKHHLVAHKLPAKTETSKS